MNIDFDWLNLYSKRVQDLDFNGPRGHIFWFYLKMNELQFWPVRSESNRVGQLENHTPEPQNVPKPPKSKYFREWDSSNFLNVYAIYFSCIIFALWSWHLSEAYSPYIYIYIYICAKYKKCRGSSSGYSPYIYIYMWKMKEVFLRVFPIYIYIHTHEKMTFPTYLCYALWFCFTRVFTGRNVYL